MTSHINLYCRMNVPSTGEDWNEYLNQISSNSLDSNKVMYHSKSIQSDIRSESYILEIFFIILHSTNFQIYNLTKKQLTPWIESDSLENYETDPLRTTITQNEVSHHHKRKSKNIQEPKSYHYHSIMKKFHTWVF